MDTLWPVYHRDIPLFLSQLAAASPMQRLRQVGMNCGCEYTSFPRFRHLPSYSRYDHSLGVGLIVWHFTGDAAQAAAGLLHDVATPVFAHTVDFLQGDHLHQEATEGPTAALISASEEIRTVLNAHSIAVEDVWDYHRYPIADNDPPGLSADRLEYTLGNLVNYGFASSELAAALYADLTVVENEQGAPELAFSTPERAAEFALASLKTSRVYVADEDRFSMELLSRLLRLALERGVLTPEDLQTTPGWSRTVYAPPCGRRFAPAPRCAASRTVLHRDSGCRCLPSCGASILCAAGWDGYPTGTADLPGNWPCSAPCRWTAGWAPFLFKK